MTNRERAFLIEKQMAELMPHSPTHGQAALFRALGRFLVSDKPNCTLVIRGYAGTGKTTSLGALVRFLYESETPFVLLAPTGRAAKVLSERAGHRAYTIHKYIYYRQEHSTGVRVRLAPNKLKNAVFIVDEASMIGHGSVTESGFGHRNLSDDLMEFVFTGRQCRLVLVGDGAQLPPVGSDQSPALDIAFLRNEYNLTIAECLLTEVVRQDEKSGVLRLATALRNRLEEKEFDPPFFRLTKDKDVTVISGSELSEHLDSVNRDYGEGNWIVITRSNKQANLINRGVRQQILWREEELSVGDLLMVVKNNYLPYFQDDNSKAGFIANGDTLLVEKVFDVFEKFGFRFGSVRLRFPDMPEEEPFEAYLLLDTINEEGPSLSKDKMQQLFDSIVANHGGFPNKAEMMRVMGEDPYYNALQVKFAYCVTCHKSQGGQWPVVFLEQGWFTDDMIGEEYLRWLYTAITRAEKRLYLVNFSPESFDS